jgi:hypothetical protein
MYINFQVNIIQLLPQQPVLIGFLPPIPSPVRNQAANPLYKLYEAHETGLQNIRYRSSSPQYGPSKCELYMAGSLPITGALLITGISGGEP